MTEFKNNIGWIQNGEPVSAGFNGSNSGVINRPLKELLNNTKHLNERLTKLETKFVNKEESFFITTLDNNVKFRVVSSSPVSCYLPSLSESDDGLSVSILKVNSSLSIIPQGLEKILNGNMNQVITNTEQFAFIHFEYIYSTRTWYPIHIIGSWSFI